MRILTTLLALLLASPVFAETYVCSYLDLEGDIATHTYSRTASGFSDQSEDGIKRDIIHEDDSLLVLHHTLSGGALYDYLTAIAQIDKSDENRYVHFVSGAPSGLLENNFSNVGTCTVVE